jgi:hypothetical protein
VPPSTEPRSWGAVELWSTGGLLLLVLAAGLAGLAESPCRPWDRPRLQANPRVQASSRPPLDRADRLLEQLAIADRQWWPRAEPLPGGGTRYVYRRRPGDPALTLEQIKQLMRHPPTFALERQRIADLRRSLLALGVRLELGAPHKPGAAGEWDPAARTLRIKPAVVAKGSAEFARVLNHEAIHVAQSCQGGGIGAQPQPLGLPQQLPAQLQSVLQAPTYARASATERQLEREAYAHQDQLDLGLSLLSLHC